MSESHPNYAGSESLDEQIVAYLDGEMEPTDARQLEDRLATDDQARRRLNQLAASWDLLDQLPRTAVDDGFAHTTVEMVAVAAQQEIASVQSEAPARLRRRWGTGILVALLAGIAGFILVAVAVPDRNDALLRDLPIVQNFEVYRQIGDIEFLRGLSSQRLFVDDVPEGPGPHEPAGEPADEKIPDSIGERRAWVEAESAGDKADLRRNFEKFASLSSDEQKSLRALDEQLRADPQADQLRAVAQRYHDWLKNRSPADRAELTEETNLQKKMATVVRMRSEQTRRMFNWKIYEWMARLAEAHQADLLALASEERRADFDKFKNDPMQRRFFLTNLATQKWWGPRAEHKPPVTEADIQALRERLPPDLQLKMDRAPDLDARVDLLRDWLRENFKNRGEGFGPQRGQGDNRWARQMTAEQREKFMSMTDDQKREFRQMLQKREAESPRQFGQGRPGGNRQRERGKGFGPDREVRPENKPTDKPADKSTDKPGQSEPARSTPTETPTESAPEAGSTTSPQ